MKKTLSLVNYDTKWTNEYSEGLPFYFKAGTPVNEIILKLEEENTENISKSVYYSYDHLYRNLTKSYKGWQVLYREPGSTADYHSIRERINYKPNAKRRSLQHTVLKQTLLWTHEFYPLIDRVEIKNAGSCEIIAEQLNEKINQPNGSLFLKHIDQHYADLSKSYEIFKKESSLSKNYHSFYRHLQILHNSFNKIVRLNSKNYQVQASNVSDILQINKVVKSTKGWKVKILKK